MTAAEKFIDIYISKMAESSTNKAAFYKAVDQWQKDYGFDPQLTNYNSFKASLTYYKNKRKKITIS